LDFEADVVSKAAMTDDPLYRREILRLAADATGAGHLPHPDAMATAHNPACGDRVTVELAMDAEGVTALAHVTQACVLTQASAALLAAQAPGQTHAGLVALADGVRAFLKGGTAPEGYGVFDGVASHAGRHVCVLLPLEAALKALESAKKGAGGAEGQPPP
jgi:NifU-like protein involved in Fe-S cluster formation